MNFFFSIFPHCKFSLNGRNSVEWAMGNEQTDNLNILNRLLLSALSAHSQFPLHGKTIQRQKKKIYFCFLETV